MKIEKHLIEENNIYNNLVNIFLKLLLLFTPLFVNKYVYDFRVNQEAILKLFTLVKNNKCRKIFFAKDQVKLTSDLICFSINPFSFY